MGRSCGLLGLRPFPDPLWAPPGLLWGLLRALPRARGAPRSPKSTKNQQKHEKYRVSRGSSWEHRVFARFGFILDPQNVAKSSENAGLPAENSYFTRVLGCIFTLFFEPREAQTHVFYVCSALFKVKHKQFPRGPKIRRQIGFPHVNYTFSERSPM